MNIKKAFEITDARIQFVSLVNKTANKKQFLIMKAEKGQANFSTCGRIVKIDEANHYITGIVYEPMAEDAHGNYMSEEEIIKAAYWFAKNGDSVDIQHSFTALKDAAVVENWVAKADFDIDGETIKKGTWLITVKVSDNEVWDAVQKGEITGFTGMMYRLCRNDVPAYAEMMCGFAEWRMFASYAPRRTSFTKGTSFAQGAYIIIKPPTGGFFGCGERI